MSKDIMSEVSVCVLLQAILQVYVETMNKFTLGLYFHLFNTPSFIRQSANEAGDLSVQRQLTATELIGLKREPCGLVLLCVRLFACQWT